MSPHTLTQAVLSVGENAAAALVAKATLAMLAALLAVRLARGASASVRHLVVAATFGALLFLPVAAALVPARVIPVPSPRSVAPPEAAANAAVAAPRPEPGQAVAGAPAGWLRGIDGFDVARGVYLLGVAWLGASLLVGIGRLHRMRRGSDVSVAGTRLANEMARRGRAGGGDRGGRLARAGRAHHVRGRRIRSSCFPRRPPSGATTSWRRAIRHELEHVARGDWATHLAARAALALYWPHPFAWVLWRRLRLEAERACDDAVIRSHGAGRVLRRAARVPGPPPPRPRRGAGALHGHAQQPGAPRGRDPRRRRAARRARSRLTCLAAVAAAVAGRAGHRPAAGRRGRGGGGLHGRREGVRRRGRRCPRRRGPTRHGAPGGRREGRPQEDAADAGTRGQGRRGAAWRRHAAHRRRRGRAASRPWRSSSRRGPT